MPKTYHTSIDLDAETRAQIIALLNQHLADTFDLYSQTKQAHWNVKGAQFFQLHELYDKLAAELIDHVDTIAERATALGGTALGTLQMAAKATRLGDYPAEAVAGQVSLQTLVERFAALATTTRAAIEEADKLGDANTADLFTGVSRALDKSLWFLEAHLQA
ncbi:MAG: DNA starvation/stationary phase protection protein Dps [Acidobacteria bacterium]|nr:DNA starvation/stationary phase protection protein Dps [Acidobacteriota bacterium]MBI3425171.1 DNA starvation/stationary phase protection protein Dps [Acidobacteriota bacterium]